MYVAILHGIGSAPGAHWQEWLANQLLDQGHVVTMPSLPNADNPDRADWLSTLQQTVQDVACGELILVGHSLGVTTALDLIQLAPSPVHSLVSVSGFAHDYGSDLNGAFLRARTVDLNRVRDNLQHAFVYFGDDDPYVTQSALQDLANGLGVQPNIVASGKHLNAEAGFTVFPQLLEAFRH